MARAGRLTRSSRALGVTVMVTLLHLGVLAYLATRQESGPAPAGGASVAAPAHRWKMRWIATPRQPDRSFAATHAQPPESPSVEPVPTVTVPLLTTSSMEPETSPPEVQVVAAPDEPLYLPRSVLSKSPRAIGIIDIPFPDGLVGHGHYESTLALYIDETGAVRKVEVTGPELPPPLEEAARLTFMKASFTPGEKDGIPVKTKIVVEVVFDDTEPMSPPQANASSQDTNAG